MANIERMYSDVMINAYRDAVLARDEERAKECRREMLSSIGLSHHENRIHSDVMRDIGRGKPKYPTPMH